MRQLAILSLLSMVALLSGCGGQVPKVNATPPSAAQPLPQPPAPDVRGNWEFSTTSNVEGNAPLRFAGSIDSETDPFKTFTDFNGTLHIDGSKCFDRVAPAGFTGTATADKGSATITTNDGQVVTLAGVFAAQPSGASTNMMFTGTYSISGGCASGDQGKITGINIPYVTPLWYGTFTSAAKSTFKLSTPEGNDGLEITSGSSSNGVDGIVGNIATDSPCFGKGTLPQAAFPSGSFILGRSVVLEGQAGDSVLRVEGTLSDDAVTIRGSYTISGGGCSDSGTVFFQADPWWL